MFEIELFFLDKLSEKDIICYIYNQGFGLTAEEIAKRRELPVDSVRYSVKKAKRLIDNHKEQISVLQEIFCL